MTETERLQTIVKILDKVEVRGSENIQIMYNLLGFIHNEIKTLDELEKAPPKQEA